MRLQPLDRWGATVTPDGNQGVTEFNSVSVVLELVERAIPLLSEEWRNQLRVGNREYTQREK